MRIAVNVVACYAAWFAVAFAAAADHPHLASAASLAVIALHLALTTPRNPEVRLLLAAGFVGFVVESLLMAAGLTRYAAPWPVAGLPPVWIVLLWLAFATLINVSLTWLKSRLALAAVLGLIAAPLSYLGGAKLGAMSLTEPLWLTLAAIGAAWAIAFPLLLELARRMD